MAEIKVYKFGVRWHWRCDHGGKGQCEGGPKRTQQAAMDAATEHYDAQHRARDERDRRRYDELVAAGLIKEAS